MSAMREGQVRCLDPHGFHFMRYTEWGESANPRVLVCVHGLTRNGRDFDYLAERLADAYRVICPDVAGRGGRDRLRHPPGHNYPGGFSGQATPPPRPPPPTGPRPRPPPGRALATLPPPHAPPP